MHTSDKLEKNRIIDFVKTDLIQSKKIKQSTKFNYLTWLFYFFTSKQVRIQTMVRFRRGNLFLSIISKLWLDRFFIEIGRQTKIGSYFFLPHPRCIIIANDVELGNHIHVGQHVTIGGNFKKKRKLDDGNIQKLPIIGSRVHIHPGAVIGGPVTIGNDFIVGANSVVTHDVSSNSIVYGQNTIASKKIKIPNTGGEFTIIR